MGPATGVAPQTLQFHSSSVKAVAFSPDGRLLAYVSNETVKMWNPATLAALQPRDDRSNSVSAVAFSPDEKLLASASSGKIVRLWDPTKERRCSRANTTGSDHCRHIF